ncbi:Ppx/GppA phosphatase family protein [Cellulomonas marina]|uniref:Ppx/GppA phosphatase family protein n=1 Tax=Cellulomonas marina TaxID=988821 RepID=UPI000B7E29D2|nr:Ppx/GppA phosphatase family protein [Cellulomonas marina]GIG28907.1 exopolyphosphatase [Cellulomonas marina]
MTRVAAIDCGTNSIRLLVADVEGGTLTDVDRRMEVVRLGQGVDRTGRLAPEALARTLDATRRYADRCVELGVEPGAAAVRFVATSATRDAENRDEFVAGVRDAIGVEPEVVAGHEEAALSFRGAVGGLAAHPGPYVVVDLGGGSTELVVGTGTPDAAWSMDVGCVRLTERHLRSDPPAADEVAAARADVAAALDEAAGHVDWSRARTLVGLAGTVTTVTAHALGLPAYQPERIDGSALAVDAVLAACDDLLRRDRASRAALPFMHPGRVDVIGAGALVWHDVVARVDADVRAAGGALSAVVTSEHDILDGIALSVVDRAARA